MLGGAVPHPAKAPTPAPSRAPPLTRSPRAKPNAWRRCSTPGRRARRGRSPNLAAVRAHPADELAAGEAQRLAALVRTRPKSSNLAAVRAHPADELAAGEAL